MSFLNSVGETLNSALNSASNVVTETYEKTKNALTSTTPIGGRRTKRRRHKKRGGTRKHKGGSMVQPYDNEPTMANAGSSYMLGSQKAGRRRRRKHRSNRRK
jgi:hypothetical protein